MTAKEVLKEQVANVRDVINWWQVYVFYFVGVLYYSSAAINPVIYNVMSRDFRLAFLRMCRGRGRRATSSSLRSDPLASPPGHMELEPRANSFFSEQSAMMSARCPAFVLEPEGHIIS